MESWRLQGHDLEYDDETHTYLCDGVIIPSVTQVLSVRFGHKYDTIPPAVLKKAADRGTKVHKEIELWCKGQGEETTEVKHFKVLKRLWKFEVEENEIPILITKNGEPVCAGRLDLILSFPELAVADIKTTATLDKEYLGYQLNLYRIGYEQCYGKEIKKLFGVHIRENKRAMKEIPVREDLAWQIIEEKENEE